MESSNLKGINNAKSMKSSLFDALKSIDLADDLLSNLCIIDSSTCGLLDRINEIKSLLNSTISDLEKEIRNLEANKDFTDYYNDVYEWDE